MPALIDMQKAFNIFVVIAIIGLGVVIFMQWRALKNIKTLVSALTPVPIVAIPQRKDVTAGEFWDSFKNTADKVTIEMDLKK